MKRHHLPSVATALIDDQDVIWQAAFGLADVENEIPAQTDTVYKLWSVAKVFTAIETMRLVEEGLIDLDAPVTDHLPDLSIQSRFPDTSPITVRSILAHHSGLPRNGCHALPHQPQGPDDLGKLVVSLQDCYMAFPVGHRHKYVNVGPALLGHLIQELRGQPFAFYMQDSLLAPIGMKHSAFLSARIPAQKQVAPGYDFRKGAQVPLDQGDVVSLPSSNLYSTVKDMGEFAKFVFRGGTIQGEPLIGSETLALMYQNQYSRPLDPQPMGLGWKTARVLASERMVWHDGGPDDGTGSLIALLPERKLGVVLISNSTAFGSPVSISLALELLEGMLESKYDVEPSTAATPDRVNVEPALLDEYAGRYIAFGQAMDVSRRGDRLKAKIRWITFNLVPVSQNTFRVGHWLLKLGLADLLPLPVDLRELELEFHAGDPDDEDTLIVKMGDFLSEICPRYPMVSEPPALWRELAGDYELQARVSSQQIRQEVIRRDEIRIENGVLLMPGIIGPLQTLDDTTIVIQSGPFAGETIARDPDTGTLYHQWVVYSPITPD
jgi:CubicO group peptidase (beta-lactamase class C family)